MLTFRQADEVYLSSEQKIALLKRKVEGLVSRADIIQNEHKIAIIQGLTTYLETVNKRWFFPTADRRIDAAYKIANILDQSNPDTEFYTAVACKVNFNNAFAGRSDLNTSNLSKTTGEAINRYYRETAIPQINNYFQAGINLLIPCAMAMLFAPKYHPLNAILHSGFILGLSLILCSLAMPVIPEFAKIDKLFTEHPQLRHLLENVANCADNSIKMINGGLNQINRRLALHNN